MSMFGRSKKGQFGEWKVENSANNCTVRSWHLRWDRRIFEENLPTLFPGYTQRHIDGSSWKPQCVGYYVLE